ncbi:RNA deprotection pyrophosphohydrolase [Bacillus sp. JCM 19034]|uniref:RNA deprotection pyrophosphohydrolase n=1 Tax=Bacillus sp. JCM 19034 TaxID=1481928 RepID=UPI000781FD53|nr:nucleoside triphosphatase YtkD [Bacillus sp. JCM 19034]
MIPYLDQIGSLVKVRLGEAYLVEPGHVLIFCRFKDKWLLTNHRLRGLEFPGGKKEQGETLLAAAAREVWEETGATCSSLTYCGYYIVSEESNQFLKAIYFAEIEEIQMKAHLEETTGPVLLSNLPENIQEDERYSFIMKDDVLPATINWLKEKGYI